MFLHREIGARLAAYFREENGAGLLKTLLERCDGQPPALAVHPGGPAILEAVEDVFTAKGWPPGALWASMDTLNDIGNLGSATLLFVMERVLPKAATDTVATFAFGPGLTVEWALLERS